MQPTEPDDDRTVIRGSAMSGASTGSPPTSQEAEGGSLPAGTRLAEFEITSLLGEGGFGVVYLAWDHSLERRVALKEYMPSALAKRQGHTQILVKSERYRETFEAGRKSFVNEARLLAQFDHPSLVKVYRFWEANGTAYMVMPFYEGATLKSVLSSMSGPPDEAWIMALLAPLTEALAVLHAAQCYHRDIAPDNIILLAGSGRPLLLDFGAARRVIGDMTQALTVILKPGYAPVEQYADSPGMKQGPWTDVYALAASVHFAITGKTPPPSVGRLMSDAYEPLASVAASRYSSRFLSAIDRALTVRPDGRTASVAELRAELGLGAAAVPAAADPAVASAARVPESTAASASSPTSRRRLGGAMLGIAALLIASAAWWMFGGREGRPAELREEAASAQPAPALSAAGPPLVASAPPTPAPVVASPAEEVSASSGGGASVAEQLDVLAEFDAVVQRQAPGHAVRVVQAPTRLRADLDALSFKISAERDGEVTVFGLGPDGTLIRLLPAGPRERLSIQAGQTLQLPPPTWGALLVSEPLGTEYLLVIVSAVPRRWDSLGARFQDGYLRLPVGADAARRRLERAGSQLPYLLGDPLTSCEGARCLEYGAARLQFDVVR